MAFNLLTNDGFSVTRFWRSLIAGILVASIGCGGMVFAANQSVQGVKKEDGGYETDAPTAILIEAGSGSDPSGTNYRRAECHGDPRRSRTGPAQSCRRQGVGGCTQRQAGNSGALGKQACGQ